MTVPLYDISVREPECKLKITDAINRVIESGQFILGIEVWNFEQRWAGYCSYKYAVGVNSGTSAIEAAVRSHNFSRDSKIIVPVNTYSATAMAVCNAGCTPIFADCNESYGIALENVKEILENTENVSGIIPVHLYGIAADILQINRIAKKHNLVIIEDAAQSHGLSIPCKNDRIFSFFPTKNLGAVGDGGCVVTDSKERALWIEKWRNQGRITGDPINHEIIGTNSRLDTIQAAVLDIKLDYLDAWNKCRSNNARIYNELLSGSNVVLPPDGVFHFYVIRVKNRDNVIRSLKNKGIGCSIHYPTPLHLQEAFRYLGYKKGDFPLAEKFSTEILSLPMSPYLDPEEIKTVCSNIKNEK